jgi:DNA repair photolyase
MKIKEIEVKGCLVKSKLTDYTINPYTGCSNSCKYCYADFIKRFQNISEKWGEFVFVKINCDMLLKKEIYRSKGGHIFLSSVCDCYQSIEEKYGLTRKILEIILLQKKKFSVEILTKSSLVRRDFDLIKKLEGELGMSVNQLDEDVSKIIEPLASVPSERINVLKEANEYGIRTYGFISPVLPGITNLDEVFREMKKAGVEYVWVELFNMRKVAIDKMKIVYERYFSDKFGDFEWAVANKKEWQEKVKDEAMVLEKKYNLRIREVVMHGE